MLHIAIEPRCDERLGTLQVKCEVLAEVVEGEEAEEGGGDDEEEGDGGEWREGEERDVESGGISTQSIECLLCAW